MTRTFPGTTIEVISLEKDSSRRLFDGIFVTGGITLSQVSVMTGLEPYLIQNWVKRGFVAPPVRRLYSREHLARIIIINMLREALQIDRICGLMHIIGGAPEDPNDDLIRDDELYHKYVDTLACHDINFSDAKSVLRAAEDAAADFEERAPNARRQLTRILQVMLYAHASTQFRDCADELLTSLQ